MKNFTIVSHDAGGAEILSHWLKNKKCFFSTVLKGPAIKIFKNNGIEITNYQLIEGIEKSNIVITGTSWQSNLEKEAIFLSSLFFLFNELNLIRLLLLILSIKIICSCLIFLYLGFERARKSFEKCTG